MCYISLSLSPSFTRKLVVQRRHVNFLLYECDQDVKVSSYWFAM